MITPGSPGSSCSGACRVRAPDLGSIFICFDWGAQSSEGTSGLIQLLTVPDSMFNKLVTCYVNLAQYPPPHHHPSTHTFPLHWASNSPLPPSPLPLPLYKYWIACKNISPTKADLFSDPEQRQKNRIIISEKIRKNTRSL